MPIDIHTSRKGIREYEDPETQKQLIQALNLICEHGKKKLIEQYTIEITITHQDATLTLYDPHGVEVEFDAEPEISVIDEACISAIDHDTFEAAEPE